MVGCQLSMNNAPCPCASGWTCCSNQNICVRDGQQCDNGTGGTGGLGGTGGTGGGMTGDRVCSMDNWCWGNPMPHGNGVRARWGQPQAGLWVVGTLGIIAHWDGSSWRNTPSGTTKTLNHVWGTGPNDIWAVGDAGALLHWNGTSWTSFDGATETLLGVSGSG